MKKKTSEVEWRTDLNDTQQKIIKLLSEDHQLSAVKLAEKIGVASRNIENNIKKLKEYVFFFAIFWCFSSQTYHFPSTSTVYY